MSIRYTYEVSSRYTDGTIEVKANDVSVGTLHAVASDQLVWSPDDRNHNVKYQFKHEDIFIDVVNELKRYKDEKGYKYLSIWAHNNGYAALLDSSLLEKAGFKHYPDTHPACMMTE